jgi:hypothetical protein
MRMKWTIGILFTVLTMVGQAGASISVFDYGIASKGRISISGSTRIIGVNYPAEGNILSATQSGSNAITIEGSGVELSGDIFVVGDEASVAITGSPSIGGTSDPAQILQHLHFGVDPPDFPTVDTSHLTSLATNVLSPEIATNGGTISNVRIPAGMNPTFDSDVTLNGVVHVEAPNIVTFAGQTTINGLIVTDDSNLPLDSCQLTFAGTLDAKGVEALPDTEEFVALKEQIGTFIVAPGFAVTFFDSFDVINGGIAADQLTWTGTAAGEATIHGSIIGLKDLPTEIGGYVTILFDREGNPPVPAGFVPEPPVMGDCDLSGYVDDDDLSILLANWNMYADWTTGDLDENGFVADNDLSLLLANWGARCSPAPDGDAVPEPATLSLLMLGGLALVRRAAR